MNLRRLDLNLLLVFDTVYSSRSNTKAAEKLGLTQSAVSNALKRLREHLDDPLFERQGQDFVPTAEANRLAPVVRDALRSIEQTIGGESAFDPVESGRIFNLVLPDSIETILLPPLIRLVRENGYGVKFQTSPLFGIDLAEVMLSKKADFVFLPASMHDDGIKSAYLFDEDACIVMRRDHPVYGDCDTFTIEDMSKVGLASLAEEVRRMTHIDSEMKAKKIERNLVCTVSRLWSIPHILATTDLVAALPRTMAVALKEIYDLKLLDLPLDRPTHHWHMMWSEELEHDPAHRWLNERIKTIFQTLGDYE